MRFIAFFILPSLTLFASSPLAFIKNPNTPSETIEFIYWQQILDGQPIPFAIGNQGTNDIELTPEDPLIDEFEAMELAFRAWEQLGIPIEFDLSRTNAHETGFDGLNLIYLADEGEVGYGGLALVTYDNTTGQILDADIHLSDNNIRWFTSQNDLNGNPLPCPCPGENGSGYYLNDIQGLASHEIGHILGLDHSAVGTRNAPATPTMYALGVWGSALPPNTPANSAYRTLEPDDRLGLHLIYASAPGIGTSTLHGLVHDNLDHPLPGASIVATHVETGIQYGALTAIKRGPYDPGGYELVGLPAGTYLVEAMPLDGSLPSMMTYGNLGGIAASITSRFPSSVQFIHSYYPLTYEASEAESLILTSGEASRADFRPISVFDSLPRFFLNPLPLQITGTINTALFEEISSAALVVRYDQGPEQIIPLDQTFAVDLPQPPAGSLMHMRIEVVASGPGFDQRSYRTLESTTQLGLSGEPVVMVAKHGGHIVSAVDTGTFFEVGAFAESLSYPMPMVYSPKAQGLYVMSYGDDTLAFLPFHTGALPALTVTAWDDDGDDLSDELEPYFGTSPTNPDTDGDFTPDGHEIPTAYYNQAGTDPAFEVVGGLISQEGLPFGGTGIYYALWNRDTGTWSSSLLPTKPSGRLHLRFKAGFHYQITVYVDGQAVTGSADFTAAVGEKIALPPIQVPRPLPDPAPAYGGTDPLDPISGAAGFFGTDTWTIGLDSYTNAHGLVLDPCSEDFLVIASDTLNKLVKVDLVTRQVVQELALDGQLLGLAISPDGSRLYTSNITSNEVHVIDTASMQLLESIALPSVPWRLALNVSGDRLIVSANGASDLFLIDTDTNQVAASFQTGFTSQYWVDASAVDPNLALAGRFVVGASEVVRIHPLTEEIEVLDLGNEINTTSGIALHTDGQRGYAMHYFNYELLEFDLSNGQILRRLPFEYFDVRDIELIDFNNLPAPARILTQPESQNVCIGESTSLTVHAVGCVLGYQWRLDGIPIKGATSSTLELSSLTSEQFGTYDCEISHSMGHLLTQTATLGDGGLPTFSLEPHDRLVDVGDPVSFEVVATNATELQWFHNDLAIPGAQSSTLSLTETGLADLGTYFCVATNSCGTSTSSATVALNLRGILASGLDRTHALGFGELELDPRLVGNPGHLGWTWYGPDGQPVPSKQPVLLVEPTTTSEYRIEVLDDLTLETVTAQTRVLVALDSVYRDYNQDGENTIGDLHQAVSEWLHPGASDANGDGTLDVRDLLYIHIPRGNQLNHRTATALRSR